MIRNVLGAALVLAALLPTVTADAQPERKPKPVWNQCRDDAGPDPRLTRDGPPVEAPHLDMISGDLLLGRTTVTAIVRVGEITRDTGLPTQDTGLWKATWRSGKKRYWAVAATGIAHPADPDSAPGFRAGVVGGATATATGVVDVLRNEVRIQVSRRALPGLGAVSGLAFEARRPIVNADVALIDVMECD